MKKHFKMISSIVIILVVLLAGSAIANFFDISFAAYGPYLVWFVALAIFFVILPDEVGQMFDSVI